MDKAELKKVIIAQQEVIKDIRYINRDDHYLAHFNVAGNSVRIVRGIRRCGKSTLMNHIRTQNKEQAYVLNFDDNRLAAFHADDFEKLYESFYELFEPEKTWYFDEIQIVDGWELFIRRLHNEGHTIFITGSNAKLLSADLGTHLTGRYLEVELFPFSFGEFLRYKNVDIAKHDFYSTSKTTNLKKAFSAYMQNGGFPEYLQTGNTDYLKLLYENIIYRDVVARYNIKNPRLIMELAHYLYSNISKEHSFNALKNLFNVANAITIKEYITYLENCYLLFTVNKFDYSLKKQLANAKKIYVIDTGLANAVSFQFSENRGRKLENLVFLHLRRTSAEIYYHKGYFECDFVVAAFGRITLAVQVSVSLEDQKTRQREMRGLKEAMELYNLRIGFIITEDEEETIKEDGREIKVIPAWKFLLEKPERG
jgi:uncharacterized protein